MNWGKKDNGLKHRELNISLVKQILENVFYVRDKWVLDMRKKTDLPTSHGNTRLGQEFPNLKLWVLPPVTSITWVAEETPWFLPAGSLLSKKKGKYWILYAHIIPNIPNNFWPLGVLQLVELPALGGNITTWKDSYYYYIGINCIIITWELTTARQGCTMSPRSRYKEQKEHKNGLKTKG